VLNVYMEEPPRVSDWRELTDTANAVVVPFFISDGLHSYEDIPQLLGIIPGAGSVFGAHKIGNRRLFYAPSIGTDRRMADIMLEQVAVFDSESVRALID